MNRPDQGEGRHENLLCNQICPAQQAWCDRVVEGLAPDLKDTKAWRQLHTLIARFWR